MSKVTSNVKFEAPRSDSVASADNAALNAESAAVVAAYRQWLTRTLACQCLDGGVNDGGFDDRGQGWCDGRQAAYYLGSLLAIRSWDQRIATDRRPLDEAIRRCVRFLAARQHPDGRLDLGAMYSPNEAGFPLPSLVEGYRRLREADDELFAAVGPALQQFILKAAGAVVAGEPYTANHRWAALGAPLAAVYSLWPAQRYLDKIEQYLADGIDCDDQGCWHVERSPNYNMVANHGLIVMADALHRPELLEAVVRNVEFVLKTLQPNGEADSSFSHRQDRGVANFAPCWFAIARRVACLTGDGRYTSLAHRALERGHEVVGHVMPSLYELDRYPGPLPEARPLPDRYEVSFPSIAVVRHRDEDVALTLCADPGGHYFDTVRDQWGGPRRSEDWLHLHCGDMVIQSLQLAAAGMQAIQPRTLERTGPGRYRLAGREAGWDHTLHFRPGMPHVRMAWDWWHEIEVEYGPGRLRVHLRSNTEHSLAAELRLWIRPGVEVHSAHDGSRVIAAGRREALHGDETLELRSPSRRLRVSGLPRCAHQMPVIGPEMIPSATRTQCGVLAVGLRFPVDVTLLFEW
jgi:hypothetical protein